MKRSMYIFISDRLFDLSVCMDNFSAFLYYLHLKVCDIGRPQAVPMKDTLAQEYDGPNKGVTVLAGLEDGTNVGSDNSKPIAEHYHE